MNENELKCPFCGKTCGNKGAITRHIICCKENPDGKPFKHSEETLAKISKHTKENMEKLGMCGKDGYLSKKIKECWEDELYKEKVITSIKKSRTDDFKNNMSKIKKEAYIQSDIKSKISKSLTGRIIDASIREKISKSLTGRTLTDETKSKIKEILKNRTPEQKAIKLQKEYNTKKLNNSFNTSKIETELKNYFDSNNILYITQYKNNLYPFCCDFYFPDKDLYVEIQGCWTHGDKPYINTDKDCIEQLELWKSKNNKFYNNAIKTWTERDVKKRNTAKTNNLNWVEIFSCDLNECLKIILDKLK